MNDITNKKKHLFFWIHCLLFVKSFIAGILIAELFLLTEAIAKIYSSLSVENQKDSWLWLFGTAYTLMIVSCFSSKNLWRRLGFVIKSLRLDLLINLAVGMFLLFISGGLGLDFFYNLLKSLSWLQLTVLIALPVIIFISLLIRELQVKIKPGKNQGPGNSPLISDKEGKTKRDDELNYSGKAGIFAERIFNQGSPESLVFAIDAPWGMGKTTFINLFKEYWTDNYPDKIICYSLDLLRYENKDNLSLKLIDELTFGIINKIKDYGYYPELKPLMLQYAKFLKGKKGFMSDHILSGLEAGLKNINKKIVVIVDDLDRLNFFSFKEVLFTIRKAFLLPNISYVLCYDPENMAALEQRNPDPETITDFLEKFINIKTGLYVDNKILLRYSLENIRKTLQNNLLVNPELVSKTVAGLKGIFKSANFQDYLPLLGNPRKLKRFINTVLLLDPEKIELKNFDFNSQDLIHLLLIYLNYPDIFRKIYSQETQSKGWFLATVGNHQEEIKLINSEEYNIFLKFLSEKQKFILNKVFNIRQRFGNSERDGFNPETITREMYTSYACFNLLQYLNLITDISCPYQVEEQKFFADSRNMLLSDKTMAQVLANEKFSFAKSESSHKYLWRALVNTSAAEFSVGKAKEVIGQAVSILPQYSLLEIAGIGVGLRKYLTFYLVKLLDQVGWYDSEGQHRDNKAENILEIARWIFGEGEHKEEGILDILGKEERGILGLYDLLLFRSACCAGRTRDIPNLVKALAIHGNPQASPAENAGSTLVEEMRLISQKVFGDFQSQFIDKNKNIFDEIDNLTMKDICGEYFNLIAKSGNIDEIEVQILNLKSTLKSFLVYQLGNTATAQRIGCFNDYLFEYCFNPQKQGRNYKHFLDYLLLNFSPSPDYSGVKYKYNIQEFTEVLAQDRLTAYWEKHSNFIKNKNYESEDKKLYLDKNVIAYNQNLANVYKVLDELLSCVV
jgi:hypothetical protein